MTTHVHLFQPGHVATARLILARGWPSGYLAVCVLCGVPVDLVTAVAGDEEGVVRGEPGGQTHERR